jgi:hypothetical protein
MSKIEKEKTLLRNALDKGTTEFNLTDTLPSPWMISTKSKNNAKKYDDTKVIYYNFRTGKYYVYDINTKMLEMITSKGGGKTRRKIRNIRKNKTM